jgi:hypothetical protein
MTLNSFPQSHQDHKVFIINFNSLCDLGGFVGTFAFETASFIYEIHNSPASYPRLQLITLY